MDAFLEFRASLSSQLDHLQEQLTLHCHDSDRLRSAGHCSTDAQLNTCQISIPNGHSSLEAIPDTAPTATSSHSIEDFANHAPADMDQETTRDTMESEGNGEVMESECNSKVLLPSSIQDHVLEDVMSRWTTLVEGIYTIPACGSPHAVVHDHVHLRAMWNLTQDSESYVQKMHSSSPTKVLQAGDFTTRPSLYMGEIVRVQSWLQLFVWHPDSKFSLVHALLCTLLITYDVISFPLMAFDIDELGVIKYLLWATTIFWSCDIPISFLQGYHSHGVVEMRPPMVARHYLKTWCIPDLIIVGIDWALLLSQSDAGGVLRAGKATRSPRFLRIGRVFRLFRTFEAARDFLDAVANETVIVMARVIGLILFVLAINHYIACAWYSIGEFNTSDELTWLKVARATNDFDTDFAKYIMSLSWSLTQFTPATNDITPANARERLFATSVVLFAFILFSFLVSSLTNAMMEIKNLNLHKHAEERLIREFLANKKVSIEVGNRVWHYYRKHYKIAKKAARESDIAFFKEIPSSLRQSLHTEIFMPALLLHPTFEYHNNYDSRSMRHICSSMEERCYVSGFELFNTGDIGSRMCFVTSGSLCYDCSFSMELQFVQAPLWISEAALWTKWVHRGHLSARTTTELLQLEYARLEKVMQQWAHDVGLLRCLRKYATLYAHHINDSKDSKTDLCTVDSSESIILRSLAHRAFAISTLTKRSWAGTMLPETFQEMFENARGAVKAVEQEAFVPRRNAPNVGLDAPTTKKRNALALFR